MANTDIAHAYRIVPISPLDHHLLGMVWGDALFFDTALPFGLRSAPKIFCAIADTLEWIFFKRGVSTCLHYIDSRQDRQARETVNKTWGTSLPHAINWVSHWHNTKSRAQLRLSPFWALKSTLITCCYDYQRTNSAAYSYS